MQLPDISDLLIPLATFFIVALASKQVGQFFIQLRLPLITGYLLTGIFVGTFMLDIVHDDAAEKLRFIDELSLAVIAFAAGSELFLQELRSRMKTIIWSTVGQLLAIYALGSLAMYMLTDYVAFTKDMTTQGRLAVSLLTATLLIARSPASAIAVIKELKARGNFTKTVLGVTVLMDVVIIALFALNTSLAATLFEGESFSIHFLATLGIDMIVAVLFGYIIGRTLELIMSRLRATWLKTTAILTIGYMVFYLSLHFRTLAHAHLHLELLIEPLLVAMIGSFYLANYTPYRNEFNDILEVNAPVIYIAFFTLTGAALQLDVLRDMWLIALVLFIVRIVSIMIGSFIGGIAAGDTPQHNRVMWMSYIAQAGVGLGLAREVAVEFPEIGSEFATMIISVIVINQVIGPVFLKNAIRRVGEAHTVDEISEEVLILGIGGESLALARRLKASGWHVMMAETDPVPLERLMPEGIEGHQIADISEEALEPLITDKTGAVVAMLSEDNDNYEACKLVSQVFQVQHLVARLYNPTRIDQFVELGARVVNPADAMVTLLDQFVRLPQAASLLLNIDPEHRIVQVTVTDEDIDNMALRDLSLPGDVLIMGISRHDHSIVPQGNTRLKLHDKVTLFGSSRSLLEVALRMGYAEF